MKNKKGKIAPIVLLPAMVVTAYVMLWSRPVTSEIRTVKAKLANLGTVTEIRSERTGLEAESQRLQHELDTMEESPSATPASKAEPSSGLRRLQSTFSEHGIRMLEASSLGEYRTDHQSTPLDSALKTLDCQGLERWQATLQATYPAMVGLLADYAASRLPVVVEKLSLNLSTSNQQTPYWTIQLCL